MEVGHSLSTGDDIYVRMACCRNTRKLRTGICVKWQPLFFKHDADGVSEEMNFDQSAFRLIHDVDLDNAEADRLVPVIEGDQGNRLCNAAAYVRLRYGYFNRPSG